MEIGSIMFKRFPFMHAEVVRPVGAVYHTPPLHTWMEPKILSSGFHLVAGAGQVRRWLGVIICLMICSIQVEHWLVQDSLKWAGLCKCVHFSKLCTEFPMRSLPLQPFLPSLPFNREEWAESRWESTGRWLGDLWETQKGALTPQLLPHFPVYKTRIFFTKK